MAFYQTLKEQLSYADVNTDHKHQRSNTPLTIKVVVSIWPSSEIEMINTHAKPKVVYDGIHIHKEVIEVEIAKEFRTDLEEEGISGKFQTESGHGQDV